MNRAILKSNKKLLFFMALSYLDKAIIFLLPLSALYFFKDKTLYVSIEYIYSITMVLVPILDIGLSGYFFYAYRNSEDTAKTVKSFVKVFQQLFIAFCIIGMFFISINYFVYEYEELIVFIFFRIVFVLATTFLASYYRLNNKPERVLFITIISNLLSVSFLFLYFFFDSNFSLWLIFIGQALFSVCYFFICIKEVFLKKNIIPELKSLKSLIKKSFLFSWPTIIQVFILMYIVNYGKINALTKMTIDDGVLLSLTQRFSMVIFLTHSSLLAYLLKDIYIEKNVFTIKKSILFKYFSFLSLALVAVLAVVGLYYGYMSNSYNLNRVSLISSLLIGQTFLSCIYAHLEMYYGRENKNIIKLYLAIFGAIIFVSLLSILKAAFLERFVVALFASTFISLLASIFILYKRNYKIV